MASENPSDNQNGEGQIKRGIRKFLEEFRKNIVLTILSLLLVAFIAYLVAPFEYDPFNISKPDDLLIYQECYHLGDVMLDEFCHAIPQPNPFEKEFELDELGNSAYIQITTVHIDPDEINAPVRIYLNGKFIDYLNRYVREETFDPKNIKIPLRPEDNLQIGENNVMILVGNREVNQAYKNVDDIEFYDLWLRWD